MNIRGPRKSSKSFNCYKMPRIELAHQKKEIETHGLSQLLACSISINLQYVWWSQEGYHTLLSNVILSNMGKGISHLSLSGLPAHRHYASLSLCQSLLRCHNQPNGELQEDPEQHELELLQASHQKSDRLEWYKLWSVRRFAFPFGQSHIVCELSFEQIKKCSKVKALTYDQY